MIVVDSSVWISALRAKLTPAVQALRDMSRPLKTIVVGDLILLEVLQGTSTDAHAAEVEADLRRYRVEPMLGTALAGPQ